MTKTLQLTALGVVAMLLSSCDALEPYDRDYTWRATGASQANLAAMAANPADLVQGRGSDGSDGLQATAAIERLRHGKVKALIDGNTTSALTAGGTPAAASSDSLTGN